jgi:FkbM family methyltransferase
MGTVHTPNGIFKLHDEDIYIKAHMSQGQVYENHIINGVLKQYIAKSRYIVDAGANIGCHAISYANMNKDAEVWAFEPQKSVFDVLSHNIKVNALSERVYAFQHGLGHANKTLNLCKLDEVFDERRQGFNRGGVRLGEGGETLEIKTLDSLDIPGLDFLKIDVEGAEGLVIEGATETIKKYRPIVFFEHNSQTIDPKLVGLEHVPSPFYALKKLGYHVFTHIDWDNYIALPWDNLVYRMRDS